MSPQNVRLLIPSYIGRVRIAANRVLALGTLLRRSAPADINPNQEAKLTTVEETSKVVDDAQGEKDLGVAAVVQPLRLGFASGWGSLHQRLEAADVLDEHLTDHGARARALMPIVFPEGREFTRLAAVDAWAYGRRVLERIEVQGLTAEVEEIAGPQYLATAKAVTRALGEPLGLGEHPRRYQSPTAVSDAMEEFTTALVAYTRSLAADVDENDDDSCRRFLAAVAPMDLFRVSYTASGEEVSPADAPHDVPPHDAPTTGVSPTAVSTGLPGDSPFIHE